MKFKGSGGKGKDTVDVKPKEADNVTRQRTRVDVKQKTVEAKKARGDGRNRFQKKKTIRSDGVVPTGTRIQNECA